MTSILLPMNPNRQTKWQELPPVVSDSLIHKFMYWDQEVKAGMRYGMEIYTLLKSYSSEERLQACDLGCEYQQRGAEVCITVSKTSYSVWLNLKSLCNLPETSNNLVHSIEVQI